MVGNAVSSFKFMMGDSCIKEGDHLIVIIAMLEEGKFTSETSFFLHIINEDLSQPPQFASDLIT